MTRLVILAILQSRPMHGYEIQQIIQEQQIERWANILSGSIYFAINQMEKEGLIIPVAEERTGNRLRKKYAITGRGRESMLKLLREALVSPPHSLKSDFSLALGLAMLLSPEERDKLLRENIGNLDEIRKIWQIGQKNKSAIHPAMAALFQNDLELIERDRHFLEVLVSINNQQMGGGSTAGGCVTHLWVRTTGVLNGNPVSLKETILPGEYQNSLWWKMFQSPEAGKVFEEAARARNLESFTIHHPGSGLVTEILAVKNNPEEG